MTDDEDQPHTALYCRRCGVWEADKVGANPGRCYHCYASGRVFMRFYEEQGTEVSEVLLSNWREHHMPWVIDGMENWRPRDLRVRIPWL